MPEQESNNDTLSRARIEDTISALQRDTGALDAFVRETTLSVLRAKLSALGQEPDHIPAQRKQVTILFANVSGFTRIVEKLRDTNLLDLMNLLWRELDEAIAGQGGTIDKHLGDGVMGVFGVPMAHEDDPERAVRAALAMRAALSDFIHDLSQLPAASLEIEREGQSGFQLLRELQIQIGVNTGPVLTGQVGTQDEITVIGDAVNVGRRLEQAAPAGGILIAHDTYVHVRGQFHVEGMGPVAIKGRSDPVSAYMVLGARPRQGRVSSRGVEGLETRMVGRDAELQQLQSVLQHAAKSRQGQLLTITGKAGVGKSRLSHEFGRWVRTLSLPNMVTMKGRANPEERPLPYTLIRDLFTTYFDIHDNDRAAIAEEKFVQGMRRIASQEEADVRQRVRVIAHLIGLGGVDAAMPPPTDTEPLRLQDRAFRYVTGFLAVIAAHSSVTLLILEDIHWSDVESLALLRHVSRVCRQEPLLIFSLARPSLLARAADWLTPDIPSISHGHLTLRPLPVDDSHDLVQNILRKLPEVPPELAELIVQRAEGNPFYVEELVKTLIEDGVIIPGEETWRLQANRITRVRVPPTLTGVLQARLDRLSTMERTTLQKAAVVGRVFWDGSIAEMHDDQGRMMSERDLQVSLQALEKRELIFRRHTSGFAGAQAFIFKHAMLRDVTYESVLLRQRPAYHRQVASWLVAESGERVNEYASAIAGHYEHAGDLVPASRFYGLAAEQAEERYYPDLAIDYYRKVLVLIQDYPDLALDVLPVYERLGQLLVSQVRLVEANQVYGEMENGARLAGDLETQAKAFLQLAAVGVLQANYDMVLEHAQRAEQIARLVNAELELLTAYLVQGQAQMALGQYGAAQGLLEAAYTLSNRLNATFKVTDSLKLLAVVHLRAGEAATAVDYLRQLAGQERDLSETDLSLALIHNRVAQGHLAVLLAQYDNAAKLLLGALRQARVLEEQDYVTVILHELGDAARRQGNAQAAVKLLQQALDSAQTTADKVTEMNMQLDQALAYNELKQYPDAVLIFRRLIDIGEDASRMARWGGLAKAYVFMADAYLGLGNGRAAHTAVLKGRQLAASCHDQISEGYAWRLLGAMLSRSGETAVIGETRYNASACFARGFRLLRGDGDRTTGREQAQTLMEWSQHEAKMDRAEKAWQLKKRAQNMAAKLGIKLPKPSSLS